MLKIGLTGGLGCGKTTVANLFAAKGVPVLDADQIARELVEPGQPALAAIVREFGEEFLEAGQLNRVRLREVVFQCPERKRQLESILHPMVFDAMQRQLATLRSDYCILCIPLLLETKQQAFVDRILVVDCPVELQYERVKNRDGLEMTEIGRIIQSQVSRQERLAAATEVIENSGHMEQLVEQVEKLHRMYRTLARN
ncbi:MAG TPA: dephospho-CoA kinase [Methylococcaceae bacterium]|nr:dephospho-CoA kinase [Methylococcaceae bacterium]